MTDTPEYLLARLADSPQYPYPQSIIQEMIDRRGEMVPALLRVLTDATRRPQHYLVSGNG